MPFHRITIPQCTCPFIHPCEFLVQVRKSIYRSSFGHTFPFLWGLYLGVESLSHSKFMYGFVGSCQNIFNLQNKLEDFTFHQRCRRTAATSYPLRSPQWVCLIVGLIWVFPVTFQYVSNYISSACWPLTSSFGMCKIFPTLTLHLVFLQRWRVLYTFRSSALSDSWNVTIFPSLWPCRFASLLAPFKEKKNSI